MRNLLPVLSLLMLASCYKTPLVNFSPELDGPQPVRVVRVWNHSIIAGLIPLSEVDVRAACRGNDVLAVTTKMTAVNWLLNAITGAIYSPTSADILCKVGKTSRPVESPAQ